MKRPEISVKTYFDISRLKEDEKGYLIGFFIGDGCIKKGKTQIVFALSLDDFECGILNKLRYIIEKSGKRTWICKRKNRSLQLVLSSRELVDYFREMILFENGNKSKTVRLKHLKHSREFLNGILAGLIDSDGSVYNYAFISTISRKLFIQIKYFCKNVGIKTSVYMHYTSVGNKAYKIHLNNLDLKINPLPSIKLHKVSWFYSKRRKDLWILDIVKEMPKTFKFSNVVEKSHSKPNLVWILLNDRLINKRQYLKKIKRGIYQKTLNFPVRI